MKGFCARSQASANLGRRGALLVGDGREKLDEGSVGFKLCGLELGQFAAKVICAEGGGRVHCSGEEAAAERAVGHQADAQFFQRCENLLFWTPPPQRVLALQGRDRLHGVGTPYGLDASFREAEMLYLSCSDEVLDSSGDLFDRHFGIDAMLVKEVDVVGLKTLEACVGDLTDVLRAAVKAGDPGHSGGAGTIRVEGEAKLGGDNDLITDRGKCLTEQRFVRKGP